jgi:asparagine synthase (glutamine-hydrolysing)
MMAELTPGNVKSFAVGFTDQSFDESAHARRVAGHLGTDHHELMLEPEMMYDLVPEVAGQVDEPLADASIIPTLLLSRFAREHVTVALGGDGGDELFAGYPTLQAHRAARYYQQVPRLIRNGVVAPAVARLPVSLDNISFDFKARRFISGIDHDLGERHVRWLGSFTADALPGLLSASINGELAQTAPDDIVGAHLRRHGLRDPLNRILYLDMKLYLENDILVKLDRASMMASLEARVPLLNVDFVEHVSALPIDLKLRRLRTKHLLRHALRDRLPAEILSRKKKGFGIPIGKWFKGPLREHLLSTLSPDHIREQGIFDAGAVQRLVADHLEGRQDNRKQLWTLFVFERWYEKYMAVPA